MKIVWTKKARKRFGEIWEYIDFKFDTLARRSFIIKTKDFTRLL